MSTNKNDRVLIRRGARQLSQEEVEQIAGGVRSTILSVIRTGTPLAPDFILDE